MSKPFLMNKLLCGKYYNKNISIFSKWFGMIPASLNLVTSNIVNMQTTFAT